MTRKAVVVLVVNFSGLYVWKFDVSIILKIYGEIRSNDSQMWYTAKKYDFLKKNVQCGRITVFKRGGQGGGLYS